MGLSLFCIVAGMICLIGGIVGKWKQKSTIVRQEVISQYKENIAVQQEAFLAQFKLSEEQLDNLYAPVLNQAVTQLQALTTQVENMVLHQVQQRENETLESFGLSDSTQSTIRQVRQLQQQGKTIEEIGKVLGREVGEVQLFINLSQKLK